MYKLLALDVIPILTYFFFVQFSNISFQNDLPPFLGKELSFLFRNRFHFFSKYGFFVGNLKIDDFSKLHSPFFSRFLYPVLQKRTKQVLTIFNFLLKLRDKKKHDFDNSNHLAIRTSVDSIRLKKKSY